MTLGMAALLTVLAACATPTPLPDTREDSQFTNFFIDPQSTQQTIRDAVGGNFIHKLNNNYEALEAVSTANLEQLNPKTVRVRINLEDWEPDNDNLDPLQVREEGFYDDGFNHATFLFVREMTRQGKQIVATVWDVPGWMVANPQLSTNKYIPPDRYAEVIESLSAWLTTAQELYGAKIAYLSFNEPNIGVNISLAGFEYANFILQAGQRFEDAGLDVRWLIGDVSNIAGSVSYAQSMLRVEGVRPYLGPFAFHSWDATASDEELLKIRQFANDEDLEVWCTEGGWDAFLWRRPDELHSWQHALNLAAIYNRLIKLSGAEVIQYWEMMGQDYQLNDGTVPFPAMEVLKLLARHLPAGSKIVTTSANTPEVVFFAAQTPQSFIVQMVNRGSEPESIRLHGLPVGSYAVSVLTERGLDEDSTLIVRGRQAAIDLPPLSVVTINAARK